MTNSVDRLFEQVLSQLPDPGSTEDRGWLDISDDTGDALDNPPDGDEGEVFPYREIVTRDNLIDRLADRPTVPEMPDDSKDLVDGGMRSRGFEAIAFYKSKRFVSRRPFVGRWGIFYINEGLSHLAWLFVV